MLELFLHHAPREGIASPYLLHHRVREPYLSYMATNTAGPVSDNMNIGEAVGWLHFL